MINNLLNALQPYLPEIYFFTLVLGILFIVFLIWFMGRSIAHRLRQKTRTKLPEYEDSTSPSLRERWMSFKEKWLSFKNFLQKSISGVKRDEISNTFLRTLEILKSYLGTAKPQYDLPWYLMAGAEDSGKTTLLGDLDLEKTIGDFDKEISSETDKVKWYFFEQALVLNLKGQVFLEKDRLASEQDTYTYILNLLARFRPRRPLDGLILTLPADEMLNFAQSDISARAHHISTQLFKLQTILGMRIPIYILVTKSDKVPGFRQFVSELNVQNYQDIVGWSSPYSLETNYTTSWSQEIFTQISHYLNKIRSVLLTLNTQANLRQNEGRFLFPVEFSRLRSSLTTYLDILFKESSYHESFFLRGVYFCGEADMGTWKTQPLFLSSQNTLVPEPVSQGGEKVVFLRDLFEKKIFREFALGKPIKRLLTSTYRLLNIVKATAVSLAVLWLVGLFMASDRINEDIKSVLPALEKTDDALTGLKKFTQDSEDPKFQAYLREQSQQILNAFANIQAVNLNSLFLPLSWFSTVDQEIFNSLAKGYDQIIFPSFYAVLSRKAGEIVTVESRGNTELYRNSDQKVLNPLFLNSFGQLRDYLRQINLLESLAEKYNNLKTTQSMTDLGELINYLYNQNLPGQFYQNNDYYKEALPKTSGRPFDIFLYKNAAIEKLGVLYRNFTEDAFNLSATFPIFASLAEKLAQLENIGIMRDIDDVKLREISEEAIAVADALSSGYLSWIERDFFDPGPMFTNIVNEVIQSSLLGNDIAQELSQRADQEFVRFKLALQTYQSNLTGSFFDVRQGETVASPSKGLVQFIDAMSAFLDEPFMWKTDEHLLYLKVPLRKILFWDENILRRAVKYIDAYNDFSTKKVKSQPGNLHTIMRTIGRNSVRKKVLNAIAEAEVFQEEPLEDSFGQREILHGQVENIALVTPFFAKLLGAFHDGASIIQNTRLRELLVTENYGILTKIEHMLEDDNLYTPNDTAFINWDGEAGLSMKAFSVHDLNDMKAYLKAQRFQLQFLAKELAEPVLTLLSLGYLQDVPVNLPLTERWTRILAILVDYDKQTPGNTLKDLEQFIAYRLNDVTFENVQNLKDEMNDFGEGDYFIQIRDDLIRRALKRSRLSEQRTFYERYHQAAQYFNTNLAGRFPFTRREDQDNFLEADPVDVANFFELYENIPQKDLKILSQKLLISGADGSVRKFIQDIESIKPLMLAALDPDTEGALPRIDIDVEFRTDRTQERGGEKIIDWNFQIAGQKTDFLDQKMSNTWQMGNPILVSFRWAQDADNLPLTDPRKPYLSVADFTATYTYTGRWSLIRLIKEHLVQGYKSSVSGPQAQTLEFRIPTAFNPGVYQGKDLLSFERRSEEAKVYLRVILKEPSRVVITKKDEKESKDVKEEKNSKAVQDTTLKTSGNLKKTAVLAIPDFPVQAPLLRSRTIKW